MTTRPLLLDRGFAPLFACQFLSALGDNILRNAIGVSMLWSARAASPMVVPLTALAFVAPSILLSGMAGVLADRSDKATLAIRLKMADLIAAGLGAVGLALGSWPLLFLALIGAGGVAALFMPVKYGILPERLPPERLPGANALIEGATFLAIIGGTGAGAALLRPIGAGGVGLLVAALALVAWLASLAMPPMRPNAPDLRLGRDPFRLAVGLLRACRAEPALWRAALVNAWFWMIGGMVLSLVPPLARDSLRGSADLEGVLACVFALGIGAGSGMASFLCRHRLGRMLPAIGALTMGVALCDAWRPSAASHLTIDLFLSALGAGLIAVPSMAEVQARSPERAKGRMIAALNLMSSLGVVAGSALLMAGEAAGLDAPNLFGLIGVASLGVGGAMLRDGGRREAAVPEIARQAASARNVPMSIT